MPPQNRIRELIRSMRETVSARVRFLMIVADSIVSRVGTILIEFLLSSFSGPYKQDYQRDNQPKISHINSHHPLLLMSCSLLVPKATPGIKVMSPNYPLIRQAPSSKTGKGYSVQMRVLSLVLTILDMFWPSREQLEDFSLIQRLTTTESFG